MTYMADTKRAAAHRRSGPERGVAAYRRTPEREETMLTSRCMLPWLRSAPYPALCPREPLGPVGDMQAVSCGARSRQYSPLLPASLLFWSRLVLD